MSSQKLSEADKTELVRLYRQTDETTATLARRFQVSGSTVSRILKTHLSNEEYDRLIQQKRHLRYQTQAQPLSESLSFQANSQSPSSETETAVTTKSEIEAEAEAESDVDDSQSNSSVTEAVMSSVSSSTESSTQQEDNLEQMDFSMIQAMFGEDVGEEDDFEESEELDWESEQETTDSKQPSSSEVEVLPLSQAKFPKTCYLVIDRGANLITKPLKEFSDLGTIPSVETQQKTLPIFDSHRVARRFSNRSQKVIKIPDGKMIKKTREYLEAKGIKRILMDGKVYKIS